MEIDWSVVITYLPQLLQGAKTTIYITILGLVGGLLLGSIAGLMRAYGGRILNGIAFVYIELIRGTPIVVQVMFLYFALPVLADIRIDPMGAAVLSIVVNAGALYRRNRPRRLPFDQQGAVGSGPCIGLAALESAFLYCRSARLSPSHSAAWKPVYRFTQGHVALHRNRSCGVDTHRAGNHGIQFSCR